MCINFELYISVYKKRAQKILRLELAEKYLHRVMLDPACGGIDLIELLLRLGYDIALFVKNDGA